MKKIELNVVPPAPVSDAAETNAAVAASVKEKGTVQGQPATVEKVASADADKKSKYNYMQLYESYGASSAASDTSPGSA